MQCKRQLGIRLPAFMNKLRAKGANKMNRMMRSRIEITHDILRLCANEPKKRTHIMYKASLSFEQLNDYVSPLLSNGLLARRDGYREPTDCDKPGGHVYYMTTEKGKHVLQDLAKAVRHVNSLFNKVQAMSE